MKISLMSGSELSVLHLQYWGGGDLWGHFRLPVGLACSLWYQGQVFGAYPWGRYPHCVVPGEAGKSCGGSQNLISSSHVAFTLGSKRS